MMTRQPPLQTGAGTARTQQTDCSPPSNRWQGDPAPIPRWDLRGRELRDAQTLDWLGAILWSRRGPRS